MCVCSMWIYMVCGLNSVCVVCGWLYVCSEVTTCVCACVCAHNENFNAVNYNEHRTMSHQRYVVCTLNFIRIGWTRPPML